MSTIEQNVISGLTLASVTDAEAAGLSSPAPLADGKPGAFYLQSRVDNADWVLSRNREGNVRLAHKSGAIGQLWTREDDPRGGFFLVNAETGEVLTQTRLQGGGVVLRAKNLSDSLMLWRAESWGGGWIGLNTFVDWEQKLNLAGNGPYNEQTRVCVWEYSGKAPNESWQMIADLGPITVESITYDLRQARVSLQEPALCEATAIDNRHGDIPIETSVELARSVSVSRQFSYSDSTSDMLKIAEKIGVKLGIDKIVDVSGEIAVERSVTRTTTFGEQTAQTSTVSDKVTVKVQVPPRARYEYMVRVSYGKVSVPYTAKLARVLPDGTTTYSEVTGVYTGVNSTRYDIVAVDVTSHSPKTVQTLAQSGGAPLPQL